MEKIVFEYDIKIKEHHLDSFGHMNNATYMSLYEEARWEFITNNGYGLDVAHKRKQGPIVLEANIKFKKEIKNRTWIKVVSQTEEIKGKIMKMSQKMLHENGDVASSASFVFGFMDLEKRKLITPPKEWLEAIGVE